MSTDVVGKSDGVERRGLERKRGSVEVRIENQIPPEALERDAWGGKLEFILACIGSGIGLGNVWRFPYLLFRSGGGAFLIPFILMLFLIGVPIFMLEISLGQFCNLSPLNVFKISPILKGLGYSMIFTNIIVALYYCVIISWCLYYFFCSFTVHLPWQGCGNAWNSILCTNHQQFLNLTIFNESYVVRDGVNISKKLLKTPSEEFFYRKVLQLSDGIENGGQVVWQLALCLFFAWMVVFVVLLKGVASLGKVVYFTSTFPYLLLTIMLVKGLTLEGSSIGVEFYMLPDWTRLADMKVWSDAATQIFYSLSACTGALIAMSSYNKFNNNTLRDSLIVPLTNVLTSIYAGFVIFSVLGYMAKIKGVDVEDVAADGPGLVFVAYPEALSLMPVAPLWSILFFLMMIMLGFSSLFTMSETFFTAITDEFPAVLRASRLRTYLVRGLGILVFYLLSLPMVTNSGFYLFSLVDSFAGGFPLLVIALFELTLISFIYGNKRFTNDVAMMIGDLKVPLFMFRISWAVISPIVITFSIVATGMSYESPSLFNGSYVYPEWAEVLGWLLVAFTLCFIPLYALLFIARDLSEVVRHGLTPEDEWGPFSDKNRVGRYQALNNPPSNLSSDDTYHTTFDHPPQLSKEMTWISVLEGSGREVGESGKKEGRFGNSNGGYNASANTSNERVEYF